MSATQTMEGVSQPPTHTKATNLRRWAHVYYLYTCSAHLGITYPTFLPLDDQCGETVQKRKRDEGTIIFTLCPSIVHYVNGSITTLTYRHWSHDATHVGIVNNLQSSRISNASISHYPSDNSHCKCTKHNCSIMSEHQMIIHQRPKC